jgi:hypothetical protein
MANQLNYTSTISGVLQRPDRIKQSDLNLIQSGEKQIVFGTHPDDNVEVWMYNPDGSFAGHLRLEPHDPALVISTIIDNSGTTEVLNVDMRAVGNRLALESGRYALVLNFFRDEIGHEQGTHLYVADISADRTEVLLKPVDITPEMTRQIYEFIEPSVPRVFAKAVVDQLFGKALSAPPDQIMSLARLNGVLESFRPGLQAALQNANTVGIYSNLIQTVLDRTYTIALDNMAADAQNFNVQRVELETYVLNALSLVVTNMQLSGEVDPRIELK